MTSPYSNVTINGDVYAVDHQIQESLLTNPDHVWPGGLVVITKDGYAAVKRDGLMIAKSADPFPIREWAHVEANLYIDGSAEITVTKGRQVPDYYEYESLEELQPVPDELVAELQEEFDAIVGEHDEKRERRD